MKRILLLLFCATASIYAIAQTDSMNIDPLLLNEVVVTDLSSTKKLRSINSISTIEHESMNTINGTADLLSKVPGLYTDGSTGEVFTRVFSRGISLSADDDIGWYYNALQEDGMPISAVQYYYFSPDLFHRPDVSVSRVEVVKGGKSGILAQNAPGTLINFVGEKPGSSYRSHDIITGGIHQNGRLYSRIEGYSGGPVKNSSWDYDFSYLYRYDRGERDIDYALSNGGQMKLGIFKTFPKGILSARVKYLDDQTNRYTGVAATNWDKPQPAFGMNFRNTSLLPPAFSSEVPDGRTGGSETYEFNPSNGIQSREFSTLITADFNWNGWRLTNKTKLSLKTVDWQTAIGGQPIGLENFLTYFISGDPFPVGLVSFTDLQSGTSLATVNNEGVLNAFQGLPPSYEYVNGRLPNDAIMGSGAWKKDDSINEIMNDLRLMKQIGNSTFTLGSFYAHSAVDIFTNASFIYSTYEARPRLLSVDLMNPGESPRRLSDASGLSNYGGLLFEQAQIDVNQFALVGDWNGQLNQRWTTNLGLRFESIHHGGEKYNSAPMVSADNGGFDGDPTTSFDNGPLAATSSNDIDFNYSYLSYSAGLGYEIGNQVSAFARYSKTHKAPELNYYTNNFSNVPINGKGTVQNIAQVEAGIKGIHHSYSYSLTGFYSHLGNVPYSSFEFDDQSNTLFYTPTQLNSSSTIGLEMEYYRTISSHFNFSLSATLQESNLNDFTLYDAAETVETSDDSTIDFSKNNVPHQPNIMAALAVNYLNGRFNTQVEGRYMGTRYANFENSFTLPSYGLMNAKVDFQWTNKLNVALRIDNLLNGTGLNNFFGPNEFGSGANAATAEYISSNPNAGFVVFPVQGRSIYFSVSYRFEKQIP